MGLMLRFLTFALCCSVFQETVAVLVSLVYFSFAFFFSFFEKNLTYMHLKIFISHDGVHFEISDICSLLLCVSENGGCAVVTERRQLLFFCAGVAGSFTSPRHISASVSLIYMHSGWYLTRPSHLY